MLEFMLEHKLTQNGQKQHNNVVVITQKSVTDTQNYCENNTKKLRVYPTKYQKRTKFLRLKPRLQCVQIEQSVTTAI
jgi:hypothetical protein